ncbi:MAG: hypothetical protein U0Y68_14855 [Blastocatellia bacterium]
MNKLPFPAKINSDMWVDEAIWGHRLYDEQTPWMTVLECLGILQSEIESGRAFIEEQRNALQYRPHKRLYLRNVLFNNPYLEAVIEDAPNDEESQWQKWFQYMSETKGGLDAPDYTYLRRRFSSFKGFAALVQFLQATAIEGDSNKRWTSKFVFPYGPHCLYEDLDAKGKTNDRRFFGRTGELLYLMLCRSEQGKEILSQLQQLNLVAEKEKSLAQNAKWDQIVAALQPGSDLNESRMSESPPYLPYESLNDYRLLAKDWLNLLQCRMPGYDVLPHIVNITGLHLTRYLINRGHQETGQQGEPTFIIEIISPAKTGVRELSANSYLENNLIPRKAMQVYIRRITDHPKWKEIVGVPNLFDPVQEARELFTDLFRWPNEDADIHGINQPEKLLERLLEKAETRHEGHLAKCHRSWTREIGFSSSRGSRRTRYAPTDSLLKTLVFATVEKRDEFQAFLQKLYDKYGFIIGHVQARPFTRSGDVDEKDFTDNALRLEERLASMGLLKRLSDACAYVVNPLRGGLSQ